MENPKEEVKHVIRALVCKPTLERQEEVLRRYFTPDVQFHHFLVNDTGLEYLIATYQMMELMVNYQDVTFYHITHDARQNAVAVHMVVTIRPAQKFFFSEKLHFHALLELEDRTDEDGRVKKFIKVQRDYFIRDPMMQLQPFLIGDIYNSNKIRFLIGRLYASTFRTLRFFYTILVPSPVKWLLTTLWLVRPQGMSDASAGTGPGFISAQTEHFVSGNIAKQIQDLKRVHTAAGGSATHP